MKLTPANFLTHIKNLVTGGGSTTSGTLHNDAGFKVDRTIHANQVVAAAGTTAVATIGFLVPRDYDEATDHLTVDIAATMGGATDTPTITLAPTNNGSAMTASSGTLTTAALSNTATKYSFVLNANGLKRDNLVSLVLTSGAHATDALDLLSVRISIRSTLVSYAESDDPTGKPDLGNPLR